LFSIHNLLKINKYSIYKINHHIFIYHHPLEKWKKLKQVCEKKNVHLHIDGARIYHSLAKYNLKPADVSDLYDSMTICLSKSSCCPAGAVVVGKKSFVNQLRFIKKALGGGMRQVGILCEAGIYALNNLVP
jgi:threonine aldolase